MDNFKNRLNADNKTKVGVIFEQAKDLGIINYIFVDSIDKIKKLEMELWYKNSINSSEGIWLGNGIDDQFSIKISQRIKELREEVPKGFCFVIKKGKPVLVKYVSEFKLKTPE
jgi:S-DNA-T family DNA segregation ATPase FtsK/SpoIIIE